MKILLVEDDRKAARLTSKGLREAGFLIDVAHSAEDADAMVDATDYDVIVLDWWLPGADGVTFCRDLRGRGMSAPILMLTARHALEDRVDGLGAGADDYLTKPFAFEELVARLRALARRARATRPEILRTGDLSLDPATYRVTRAGVQLNLTPTEYAILEVLMRHAGEILTRTSLGDRLWRGDDDIDNLVEVHISRLRKKLDRPGVDPIIHTVWGRGYRLGPPAA